MKNLTNEKDDTIIKKTNKLISTWLLEFVTNRNKIESNDVTDTLDTSSISEKKEYKRNFSMLTKLILFLSRLFDLNFFYTELTVKVFSSIGA